jgi:hypothetical protein
MARTVTSLADLETRIHTIRGLSVLLDSDLAVLYGVSTKALLQAMRRNPERFPSDFMFQLTNQEVGLLRSQFVTSKPGDRRGGRRALPYAFTEQGVAMLSRVLRSWIEDMSERIDTHDEAIRDLAEAIRQLTASPPEERKRLIGFTADHT